MSRNISFSKILLSSYLRCPKCTINKEYILLSGSVGFFANLLTLPVLFMKKMQNTFNHLLIFLTIFDNIYVICSILECIRQNFISTPTQTVSSSYILLNYNELLCYICIIGLFVDLHIWS